MLVQQYFGTFHIDEISHSLKVSICNFLLTLALFEPFLSWILWRLDVYLFFCFVIVIMAGFDDDNFYLSGLTQQGYKLDVTVISSSDEDDNYGGILECDRQLGGKISEKSVTSVEGDIQPLVEPLVKPNTSNFPISKITDMVSITPISMASSVSLSEKSIYVSFIHFNGF